MSPKNPLTSIVVYCGSSDRTKPVYLHAARDMGAVIARKGMRLVYGAGSTGSMGAVADGALSGGGEVIGVIPQIFSTPQLEHSGLTRLEVTPDMHARKARIAALGDAFIALPGGIGTLEEFFEILTWAQVGLHAKPVGLLNTAGYFDPLIAFLHKVEEEGFMYKEHNLLYRVHDDPEGLLAALAQFETPQNLSRWVDRDDPA